MKLRKIFIVGATLTILIAATKTGKIQSTEHVYDLSPSKVEINELTTEETVTKQEIKIETGGFMISTTEEVTTTEEASTIEEATTTEEIWIEEDIDMNAELASMPEKTTEEYYLPEEDIIDATYIDADYSFDELMWMGVIYWGDYRWTYYSESVLPGEGLNIPGRYTDETGFVCDENGYICLASSDLGYGTIVSTPFGRMGCVYDSGCPSGTLDVYVR